MKLTKYKLQKGFVVQRYPKKLVLFDSETSTMYTLNETARFIFDRIKKGLEKKKIIADLAKRYAIAESRARKDVEDIFTNFLKHKIVKRV